MQKYKKRYNNNGFIENVRVCRLGEYGLRGYDEIEPPWLLSLGKNRNLIHPLAGLRKSCNFAVSLAGKQGWP